MIRLWVTIAAVFAAPAVGYALGGFYGGVVTTLLALVLADRYSPKSSDGYVGGL